MQMDWIWGLGGGLLIGLGAAIYLLGNGRIMGASGILGGLVDNSDRTLERLCFLAGLIGAPILLRPLLSPTPETPSDRQFCRGYHRGVAGGCWNAHR